MDDLVDRLGALPTEAVSGADGWPEIEVRIRRSRVGRRRRPAWMGAAAAAVIFVAGATGGFTGGICLCRRLAPAEREGSGT